MARSLAIPFFPTPPAQYSPQYHAEVTRAFSLFAEQMQTPGPERALSLTLAPTAAKTGSGTLSYNSTADTLDLTHLNGVVQQIGFETYMRATNATGSTIPNGTVVGFSGVGAEVQVSPYIANGSVPELYFVGVTTFDMANGVTGPVTVYGKVRGLDTTGPGSEVWSVGDLLYASPTNAGLMTNIRPTAPNVVVSVAAVLTVDAASGEILVRPTVPIGLDYGTFSSSTAQTLPAINTAQEITLDATLTSNGVSRGTPTSRMVVTQAGLYSVSATLQLTSGSSNAKTVYVWLRKNGTDVVNTSRAFTSNINAGETPLAVSYTISLQPTDYIELYWAADSTDVTLNALTGLAFAPDAPSVLVYVAQTQL